MCYVCAYLPYLTDPIIICPSFFRRDNDSSEMLGNTPRITQLGHGEACLIPEPWWTFLEERD